MRSPLPLLGRVLAASLLLGASAPARGAACTDAARAAGWTSPEVLSADGASLDVDRLVARLADRRVVFVGEVHDRLDHHLNQLEIICRLRAHGPLAIGLEFFQAPAQAALDDYVHRHGDLDRLLEESEWFTRWRYDPRLYAPILRFAREQRIPLVALNVPGELVSQVARSGMGSLDAAARARLPASIHDGPPAYRERLRRVFRQHPGFEQRRYQHFLEAQLLWDEGMAQRAADYLLEHPRRRLVVLAGEGHIAYGDPIPDRLSRRVDAPWALVLQSHDDAPGAEASDYRLITDAQTVSEPGRLGVQIDDGLDGVSIVGFGDDSAARDAGLEAGDRLLALDGRAVRSFADVRLALWRKRPGDPVEVSLERDGTTHSLAFTLR